MGVAALTFGRTTLAEALAAPDTPPAESWRPWIIRLTPTDVEPFHALCREHHLTVLDTLERQLVDLAAARLPAASDAERRDFVAATVAASGGWAACGNWVYLPWEAKVVHLLAQEAYFEVITNRNADKITPEEQRILRSKRIGVIGLSVGGEAAVTVAQEHLCGHLVLADCDRLDLSNLNRLNAGVDDLGVNKATIAARRVAKIDPYLDVTVFDTGANARNLSAFLDGLDLLIEECDAPPIKREARLLARARGLNVVYAADERGFLSVEPYALWPELRPFHGRIEAPQQPRDAFPTPRAFLRALTAWLGGWDNISERSRHSLERVGETRAGYPQLASEARYAAGQVGHVARRLLLGERLPPFLENLDLGELLPGAPA